MSGDYCGDSEKLFVKCECGGCGGSGIWYGELWIYGVFGVDEVYELDWGVVC